MSAATAGDPIKGQFKTVTEPTKVTRAPATRFNRLVSVCRCVRQICGQMTSLNCLNLSQVSITHTRAIVIRGRLNLLHHGPTLMKRLHIWPTAGTSNVGGLHRRYGGRWINWIAREHTCAMPDPDKRWERSTGAEPAFRSYRCPDCDQAWVVRREGKVLSFVERVGSRGLADA